MYICVGWFWVISANLWRLSVHNLSSIHSCWLRIYSSFPMVSQRQTCYTFAIYAIPTETRQIWNMDNIFANINMVIRWNIFAYILWLKYRLSFLGNQSGTGATMLYCSIFWTRNRYGDSWTVGLGWLWTLFMFFIRVTSYFGRLYIWCLFMKLAFCIGRI